MSGHSSPVNGGYDAASAEPAMRLTVRKDLFPDIHLPKLASGTPDSLTIPDEDVSCVKLETDFEQSIDDIASQKLQVVNGSFPSSQQQRHRKHKQRSRRDSSRPNGCLPLEKKKKKKASRHKSPMSVNRKCSSIKGGKNLHLVSSSEFQDEDSDEDDEIEKKSSDTSDDEVLQYSVKLPVRNVVRQSGKPFSHELSQLASKKSKSKVSKEKRTHAVVPCSGKPRSMLDICSSTSKKKSKKTESTGTYQSQIVNTSKNIKIKIRRTSIHENVTIAPIPTSIADIGQRKSKKKRAASPVASESSGEEYDPSRGDTAAAMSVGAPKPRHPPTKIRKVNSTKNKVKSEKTERRRISAVGNVNTGPQSPWAKMPEEILVKIFEHVTSSVGTLPSVIRLGKVCKLWHNVSCRPELWKNVDLAQYTIEKCKTDYKLVWLLEQRLSHCESLNIAHWKVNNVSWVLACVADYCPRLVELSLAGWARLMPEHLYDLVHALPTLQRLDLSLTSEMGSSSTSLSAASVARLVENFGARFTHLTLTNNKYTALPQILSSIASYCSNLEVLDISGARAMSHPAAVPLEALQKGCPKLRVFRAANAQLILANATTSQQMEAVGWSQLEELSIAGDAVTERETLGEYRFGDEALARLVRAATRLRLLDLRGLQRLSDSGLVRVPAWELQHLFLGGCNVTRQKNACLELICEKWSTSLLELDLSWATAQRPLDDAVSALADASTSKLKILNLCGSAVSLEPVKKVLFKCQNLESLNLSSCRALPRGMKRLYTGKELQDLKDSLDPNKTKAKEESSSEDESEAKKKEQNKSQSKTNVSLESLKVDASESFESQESKSQDKSSPSPFQEPKPIVESKSMTNKFESTDKASPDSKTLESSNSTGITETLTVTSEIDRSILSSPIVQSKPDSSSTPRSEPVKTDLGSSNFSPVPKPDSQVQNSPEVQDSLKSNAWNLGLFKTTPTHITDMSPVNRLENQSKLKHGKMVEQCSPTTSVDNKPSPETTKQDIRNPSSWNYGNYSPMPRQDAQFSSQRSPYSAQPSPAQPSPYSTQRSPYSAQPSPYSSQPSPYSSQPSPDTSQIIKTDLPKTSTWNTGNFSPMPKHHTPFSPHPSTHNSPDPGLNVKSDTLRTNSNKTSGQYSPMSRQDRLHSSPYSPRSSIDTYSNKKSPSVGNFSSLMRPDCHMTSSDQHSNLQSTRPVITGRSQDAYGRQTQVKVPEVMSNAVSDVTGSWGIERFSSISNPASSSLDQIGWSVNPYNTDHTAAPNDMRPTLNTPPAHSWNSLPPFDSSVRRTMNSDMSDPWTLGQFRIEPPHQVSNTFVEQNVTFESLSNQLGLPSQMPQSFLDEGFAERSRVD